MTVAGDRAGLIGALRARRDLADWTVRVVTSQVAWRTVGVEPTDDALGSYVGTTIGAEVHRDAATGRGSATLELGGDEPPRIAVTRAIARADAAIGPAWATPAPAAPATVELADPAIPPTRPAAAIDAVLAALTAAATGSGATVARAEVRVAVDDVELITRRGQRAQWRETRVTVDALVRASGRDGTPEAGTVILAPVVARARRLDDLDLAAAIASALGLGVTPATLGLQPVTLTAAALTFGDHGLLGAFAAQADPRLERQGLVRYRPGQLVVDGATLTLTSDGTLPFGWLSAPLGDRAEAVRRFPLVTRGVASGLGLDEREAALRDQLPNGGVRGLVVPPGDDDDATLTAPGTLVVSRLAWLELDRTAGWFRAGFDRATVSTRPGEPRAVGPGTLRGDAIALLARARTSARVVATPTYRGPALWHLGAVRVD